eukprot:15347822-Ditylum_brightwellii.AAC.2
MDKSIRDEGYDTDGNKGLFYELVGHEEELRFSIEEEDLPSTEEVRALVKDLQEMLKKHGLVERG